MLNLSSLPCTLQRPTSFPARFSPRAPHGQPNVVSSLYWLVTSSWLNLFLVFVPLGFVAEFAHWPAVWRFSLNFLAIVPLAKVRGKRTDE